MSFRGDDATLSGQVASQAERQRSQERFLASGPVSFSPAAFVARGAPLAAETETIWTGNPTGDPYHLVVQGDVTLRAGRVYLALGIVAVEPISGAAVPFDRGVQIGSDPDLDDSDLASVGMGVASHTIQAMWSGRFTAATPAQTGLPTRLYFPTADTTMTLALVVERDLQPSGDVPSQLVVLDVGRAFTEGG